MELHHTLTPRRLGLIGLVAWAALAVALVAQYQFNMQPCPWCVLQRLLFALIGALGLLGWLARPRPVVAAACALIVAAAASGLAAALYQHFVAARSASCNLTLADKIVGGLGLDTLLPSVFEVRASCAEAAVKVAGVPFEFWSAALYLALGMGVWWAWQRRNVRARR